MSGKGGQRLFNTQPQDKESKIQLRQK